MANPSRIKRNASKQTARRQRLDPSARRGQIVDAAIEHLTKNGLLFNTRELAASLGISHPLLFRYFASKEEIVDAVFEKVFLNRFSTEMRAAIDDRTWKSLIDKWINFYEVYSPGVFDETWIRIFISSALQKETISQRYLNLVVLPIVTKLAEDTELYCLRSIQPVSSKAREHSLELAWMTHSSLFYNGLRQWVYDLEAPKDIVGIMSMRVRCHFAGAAAVFEKVQESPPRS